MEKSSRIVALDVFRGLTIAAMVMVNQPGSEDFTYSQMRHSEWNGCTLTDMIFPFFLLIMGVAMWFSFQKYEQQISWRLAGKIMKRSLIIFTIGIGLNLLAQLSVKHALDFQSLRFTGIFPRIALCYGIASFLCLLMNPRQLLITSAIILVGYWSVFLLFAGPHPSTVEDSLIGRMDIALLGANHLQRGHLMDATGLVASMPSLVNVLAGYLLGRMICLINDRKDLVLHMFLIAIPVVLLARIWNFVFPINKLLWTSSFVLYTVGWGIIALALFIWLIDIKKFDQWTTPLLVFGINPLFAYLFASVFEKITDLKIFISSETPISIHDWLYDDILSPLAGNLNGSLLFSILAMIFYWSILSVLYKKNIIIKI